MLSRITKSLNVAVRVAILGFEKSYQRGESIDSILGFVDVLTEIPNRRAFERDAGEIDGPYSLVLVDIDNFKNINDTRGHCFGDEVLKRLARILREAAGEDGRVYRMAGDEFLLIVPLSKVAPICTAIRDNVRKEDCFTVSQGVVPLSDRHITHKLITQADWAMYQSKAGGKDRITYSVMEPVEAC
jgi:diguanylate cyclase (GGDEF)-like protein